MTEWINYHGLNRHLFVPPTQGPRPMTEPDVDWDVLAFRQWASQRWPARAKFIRDGELDFDYFADAFRAGAAASAERVTELEARVAELERQLRVNEGWRGPTND